MAGSSYDVNLYFTQNDGTYDAASGQAGQAVELAIALVSEPESGTFTGKGPPVNGTVTTPLTETTATRIAGKVVLLPILRAGLGLLDAFLDVIPSASVGFAGMRRNEDTLEPIEYYRRLPDSDGETTFIVIDPMLATGGSLTATVNMLKSVPHRQIMAACLIAAPDGVRKLEEQHPEVLLVLATVDDHLNDVGFIVPGLGDAGDRLFGTT